MSIPSTSASWRAIRSCVRWSSGISVLHGSHHEAQTFSTTTLPAWSASEPVASEPSTGSALTGASTRSPRASRSSSEVSGPFEATP